ncbi:heme-binding beta-barrel domain-containing protein [Vibrio sonorensis]|uniref:heme-binding beta-barrel domain-containing protein n=1 Tax=Vibrio sonorensis TaxID=1004316 RepID=UPI0008DAF1B4|nr:heme-binding beta-barrel domain-containing protein [Vibrio sonorensis]
MKNVICLILLLTSPYATAQDSTIINGLDFGPLAKLVGNWKSDQTGGVDVAPGQAGTEIGKGGIAVEPYYETITFKPAADAKNASDQYLVALYYEQEVFRKRDDAKFHDQRGYLIYDKENQLVYNSYCIPRAVCVVAEGKAGEVIEFKTQKRGIAESKYMTQHDTTIDFTMTLDLSETDRLKYSQTTALHVYGKPFNHSDSGSLIRVK